MAPYGNLDMMYEGGSPNFNESTGRYNPGFSPNSMKSQTLAGIYNPGGGTGGVPGQARAMSGASPTQRYGTQIEGGGFHEIPSYINPNDVKTSYSAGGYFPGSAASMDELFNMYKTSGFMGSDKDPGWGAISSYVTPSYEWKDPNTGVNYNSNSLNTGIHKNPDGTFGLKLKSADKEGTSWAYDAEGNLDAESQKKFGWNSNTQWYDYMPLAIIGGLGAGLAGAFGAGTGVMSGAGGAGTGAAGAGTAAGASAASTSAEAMTLAELVGSNPYALGAADLAGANSGWVAPSFVAGEGGAATLGSVGQAAANMGLPSSAVDAINTAVNSGDVSSIFSTLKQYGSQGNDLLKMYQQLTQQQPNQQQQGGGDLSSILNSLINLGTGYYGSQQNKDHSGNLKRIYDERAALQKPYLDQLLQSYQDPNSFYNSNQYKGLADVYQNQIDRQAGSTGRLANPTDREVLLQQHALKELNNYRQGLTDQIKATSPDNYINAYQKGLEVEANANNPFIAGIGKTGSGSAGTSGNSIQDVTNVIDGVIKGGTFIADNWGKISDFLFDW